MTTDRAPATPKGTHPLIRTAPERWIPVRCSVCGWYLCAIRPGSIVKVTCRKCKHEVVHEAA